MMGNYVFFAEALRYPAPGRLTGLQLRLSELAPGATQQVCRAFLSNIEKMNKAMQSHAVDLDGELPDHLVPVLRYLEVAPEPLPQLSEVIRVAVQRMIDVLHKQEPQNPYCQLLEGIQMQLQSNQAVAAG
jgi:hypothetical protein